MASFDFGGAVADHGAVLLRAGQVVEVVTAGGGGHGPSALREPAAVARDVAEQR
jgi:N-methylhydantoinase B/oxoprolinase/acetone carboxylase alpha subunit